MVIHVSRVRVNGHESKEGQGQWSCKLGGSGSMVMKVRRVRVNGNES